MIICDCYRSNKKNLEIVKTCCIVLKKQINAEYFGKGSYFVDTINKILYLDYLDQIRYFYFTIVAKPPYCIFDKLSICQLDNEFNRNRLGQQSFYFMKIRKQLLFYQLFCSMKSVILVVKEDLL